MTRLQAPWLFETASQKLCAVLTDAGHRAVYVGGCVRNALLERPVSDLDVATDARPERVVALFGAAGIKTIPTGIDHGTITVVVQGHAFEVTTFRRDVQTDGRHAVVAFSDKIEEDAARRDFTMNALYALPDGTVLDPLGGLPDLRAGRLRFIGQPSARIREDYLRILRFFRFQAWYGNPDLGIDAEGLAACAEGLEGLAKVSVERITQELLKLLAAPDPSMAVAAMEQSGVLQTVLPGAAARSLPVLVHLEKTLPVPPSALRRLAVLGDIGAAQRLRMTKRDARGLAERIEAVSNAQPTAELAYRKGYDVAQDVALLSAAMLEQPISHSLEADLIRGSDAVFPLRASDLMPAFKGAALGEELERLKKIWIASGFEMSGPELLRE